MTFAPFTRITATGVLGPIAAPVETFAFGMACEPGPFVTQATVDACWTAIAALISGSANIASWVHLTQVKLSSIGADGKLIGNSQVHIGQADGNNSAGPHHPPQVSLAMSLGTGQRGASKRGRFYLPGPSVAISGADLEVAAVTIGDFTARTATMLRAINTAVGGTGVVIASSKGFNTKVTTVRAGRALDTIRSRRRKLVEGYDIPVAL